MSMFDTFDRTGAVDFSYPPQVVYKAADAAVQNIAGMKIVEANQVAQHLFVKTAASAFSWGEKVTISILAAEPGHSRMQIASGAKTILGSATTHGANRRNVQQMISQTALYLEHYGEAWTGELEPEQPPATPSREDSSDPATRLTRLDDLLKKGLISEEEHRERREAILKDL